MTDEEFKRLARGRGFDVDAMQAAHAIRELLADRQPSIQPEEVTEEMVEAGREQYGGAFTSNMDNEAVRRALIGIYTAMRAARKT